MDAKATSSLVRLLQNAGISEQKLNTNAWQSLLSPTESNSSPNPLPSTVNPVATEQNNKKIAKTSLISSDIAGFNLSLTTLLNGLNQISGTASQYFGPVTVVSHLFKHVATISRAVQAKRKSIKKRTGKIAYAAGAAGLLAATGTLMIAAPILAGYGLFAYSAWNSFHMFRRMFSHIRQFTSSKALLEHHQERLKECTTLLEQLQAQAQDLLQLQTNLGHYQQTWKLILDQFDKDHPQKNSLGYQADLKKLKKLPLFDGLSYNDIEKTVAELPRHQEKLNAAIKTVENKRDQFQQEIKVTEAATHAKEQLKLAKQQLASATTELKSKLAPTALPLNKVLTYSRLDGKATRTEEEEHIHTNLAKNLTSSLTEEIKERAAKVSTLTDQMIQAQELSDQAQLALKPMRNQQKAAIRDSVTNAGISTLTTIGFAVAAFVPAVGLVVGMGILIGATALGLVKEGYRRVNNFFKNRKQKKQQAINDQIATIEDKLKLKDDDLLTPSQKLRLVHDHLLAHPATDKAQKTAEKTVIKYIAAQLKQQAQDEDLAFKILSKNPRFRSGKANELFDLIDHELRNQALSAKERLALYAFRDQWKTTPLAKRLAQIDRLLAHPDLSPASRQKLLQRQRHLKRQQSPVESYKQHLIKTKTNVEDTNQQQSINHILDLLEKPAIQSQVNQHLATHAHTDIHKIFCPTEAATEKMNDIDSTPTDDHLHTLKTTVETWHQQQLEQDDEQNEDASPHLGMSL